MDKLLPNIDVEGHADAPVDPDAHTDPERELESLTD
jgi:hypothetical protein